MTGNVNMPRQVGYPAQCYANMYSNQMFDDDTFMGLGPVGGSAYLQGGSCFNPCMPGQGYNNMSPEQYLESQHNLAVKQRQYALQDQKEATNASFFLNSDDDAITREIGILQRKVKNNEQDSVLTEYNKLISAVENKLVQGGIIQKGSNREQVKAYSEKLYFQATGKSITDDLEQNGDSEFVHGLKQGAGCGLGFLLTNNKNYEDNIADITGEDKDKTSNVWKWVGTILSGGAAAALLIFGGKKVFRH